MCFGIIHREIYFLPIVYQETSALELSNDSILSFIAILRVEQFATLVRGEYYQI